MVLYIHQLKDLTPKSADIESTFIIRDLKKQFHFPLSREKVFDHFSLFFVSETEKETMVKALEAIEPTVEAIRLLAVSKDNAYEPINLKRSVEMIAEIPRPLLLNLDYATNISKWQEEFTENFPALMNKIPRLSDHAEKVEMNQRLNDIFQKLLRQEQMAFNFHDIVYEAQKNRMRDLIDSMETGFFFRVTLEDELKKIDFSTRSRNISQAKLDQVNAIKSQIRTIKKGVDTAYEVNLRMLNWAVIVYSFIKLVTSEGQ